MPHSAGKVKGRSWGAGRCGIGREGGPSAVLGVLHASTGPSKSPQVHPAVCGESQESMGLPAQPVFPGWEAVCLIIRPCHSCRAPDVVPLRVYEFLVREILVWVWGPGISSGSISPFIKKSVVNWQANHIFTGFGGICKGLVQLGSTMCKQSPRTTETEQKHSPEHRNEPTLLLLLCIFPGFKLFCFQCNSAWCTETWPKLQNSFFSPLITGRILELTEDSSIPLVAPPSSLGVRILLHAS